jgi:hypothetical protein
VTTAPQCDVAARTFQVTHPFHPQYGQRFEMVAYKSAWGEDRVYFHSASQQLTALPASWTDVVEADPVVAVAAGRAPFRANDLLEMVQLIHVLSAKGIRNV